MPASPAARLRFLVWVVLALLLAGGQVAWLWGLRGPIGLTREGWLAGGQAALGAVLLGVYALLRSTPADAIRLRRGAGVAVVLFGAVALQAAAVAWPLPGLSADVLRMRRDARTWLSGVSPYTVSPTEMRARAKANPAYAPDAADERVDWPDAHTVAPAAAQAAALLGYALDRIVGPEPLPEVPRRNWTWRRSLERSRWPYPATGFRLVAAAAAVGATCALLALLRDVGRSPWWAVLFAWNPLVVLESGGMAHVDALGAMLLLLGLRDARRGRGAIAGLLLALAAGVNLWAVLLLPWLFREVVRAGVARGDGSRANPAIAIVRLSRRGIGGAPFRAGAACVGVCAIGLVGIAALVCYHHGYRVWGQSVLASLPTTGGEASTGAKAVTATVWIAFPLTLSAIAGARRAATETAAYGMTFALLLAGATGSPWHCMWLVAWVPLLPAPWGAAALVASATAGLSYLRERWGSAGMAAFAPVVATLLAEIAWAQRAATSRRTARTPADV